MWSKKIDNFIFMLFPLFFSRRHTKTFHFQWGGCWGEDTWSQIINYQLFSNNNGTVSALLTHPGMFFSAWQFSVIEFPPSRGPFSMRFCKMEKLSIEIHSGVKKAVEIFQLRNLIIFVWQTFQLWVASWFPTARRLPPPHGNTKIVKWSRGL